MRSKLFLLLVSLSAPLISADKPVNGSSTVWDGMTAILATIRPPVFPDKVFDVTNYGAKPDGTTDCTEAFKKAIAECAAAGGGRVVAQGGVFLTGPIHLLSKVELRVDKGATLRFLPDRNRYLPVVRSRYEGTECMNYSPLIYAFEKEDVAVTGGGTLDGGANSNTWWNMAKKGKKTASQAGGLLGGPDLIKMGNDGVPVEQRIFGDKGNLRPNFLVFYRCKNILVEGVTIINSPMWEIHPVFSSNVTVRGVTISTHGPNNDGCDPDSSKGVLIENCIFDTGDDCIAIKSGKDGDGRRVNIPSEDIVIRNCQMKDGHGGVVIGSENAGGVRNVYAENCTLDSPNLLRALRIKSNALRGGFAEGIYMRDCKIGAVKESILTIDLVYEKVRSGPFKPVVRDVLMERVTATRAPRVLSIEGIPESTISGIRLVDCDFSGVSRADLLDNAGDVCYKNVRVVPPKKPAAPESDPDTKSKPKSDSSGMSDESQ